MSHGQSFVDIHCHLLPQLDDGPSALHEAVAMAEMAVADGIGTIIATPHQLGNFARNSAATIRAAIVQFQQASRPATGVPTRVAGRRRAD